MASRLLLRSPGVQQGGAQLAVGVHAEDKVVGVIIEFSIEDPVPGGATGRGEVEGSFAKALEITLFVEFPEDRSETEGG